MKSRYKQLLYCIISCVVLAIVILIQLENINTYTKIQKVIKKTTNESDIELFRNINISEKAILNIYKYSTKNNIDEIRIITVNMLLNNYTINEKTKLIYNIEKIKGINKIEDSFLYKIMYNRYKSIFSDIKYFPVAKDTKGNETVSFEDSWNMERTYGGFRRHEGTDIMPSTTERGYFSVISVSDGVVEKKGWLDQGGYRIGVRGENGAYFYYAHLDSYAKNIEVGSKIKAGNVLGFMGDTGYGKKEGTKGNFPVHLHFGIYLNEESKEISVNPYLVLKYILLK